MIDEFAKFVRTIMNRFRYLETRVEAHERYITNMFREAKVTKVHAKEGLAEVEADGLPSAKVPWLERAGKQRSWNPPTVDERVILISPNGNPGTGMILTGGFSDKYQAPHDKEGEARFVVDADGGGSDDLNTGAERIIKAKSKIRLEIDGSNYIEITAGGILLKGVTIKENE